jgi:hypothetical protein
MKMIKEKMMEMNRKKIILMMKKKRKKEKIKMIKWK